MAANDLQVIDNKPGELTLGGLADGCNAAGARACRRVLPRIGAPIGVIPSRDAQHDLGPEALDRLHQHVMRHDAVIGVAKHPSDRQPAVQLFERAGK